MSFTYDAATARGRVRLLAFDTDPAYARFQDEEIDAFLDMSDDDPKMAAAMALEATGVNQVLVLKVIQQLDLHTDGAAVSRELRMLAGDLREQATKTDGAFDIAEQVFDDWSYTERMVKQFQREAAT